MSGTGSAWRQRAILIAALAIAFSYVWLRGGFIGLGSMLAVPTLAQQRVPAAGVDAGAAATPAGLAKATFAAGCFWSTESAFDELKGVVSTTSGYTGGRVENPSYRSVSTGQTGHAEAVEVLFDPSLVTYEELLDHYWHNVDPFIAYRQFCDVGTEYRPEIFVHDQSQLDAAMASYKGIQARFRDQPVMVSVSIAGPFYAAEDEHQDYAKKHSAQYLFYRAGCGRDVRLNEIWGK